MDKLTIALVQQDFPVGDITGNLASALSVISDAVNAGADLVLFPELALTGYPPEDLLHRPGFLRRNQEALDQLIATVQGIDVLMGHPWQQGDLLFNTISWIRDGQVIGRFSKQCLPNYAVFDEHRYFKAGNQPLVIAVKGVLVGVVICEDAWEPGPAQQASGQGAELLLVPNASPFRLDKLGERENMLRQRHQDTGLAMAYLNLVGGQDELVFDGRSMLMNSAGVITGLAPICLDRLLLCEFSPLSGDLIPLNWPSYHPETNSDIYQVLVRGLRDYIQKNGFSDVVLGLSGGIDSALTLALAVDALGASHVHTVMMPSKYTSELSLQLAEKKAGRLGADHVTVSIEPAYEALLNVLEPAFAGKPVDITEENLQARCRANILMALSNKFGWLVLSTGNKSELAVGYCTIYGDMAGGFAPIKDCLKTLVYELARYRNTISPAIPAGVIERPPSAELAHDQKDQDSLPPYDLLDEILLRYIDREFSIADIVADGFDEDVVREVARLVLMNEYKRRQAAPGVRLSNMAFGRDRRYPITSGWRDSIPES